ncbi:MAG: hypothetical protein GY757_50565 [bacterium]|nr:hypothetical protein [bacterium]
MLIPDPVEIRTIKLLFYLNVLLIPVFVYIRAPVRDFMNLFKKVKISYLVILILAILLVSLSFNISDYIENKDKIDPNWLWEYPFRHVILEEFLVRMLLIALFPLVNIVLLVNISKKIEKNRNQL